MNGAKHMRKHLVWTALVPAAFLLSVTEASAQQLRGIGGGGGAQKLLLREQIGLLNNGSLQTTQNPNANLFNQVKFIYIAAMPLGDRLGNNGVYYDTDLLPNIGLFQGGQNLMGQVNQNQNNNPNPNPFPPPFQAARMARQRMMMAMYSAYMQQAMMQQAMMQQALMQQAMMQPYANPASFGWFTPSKTASDGFGGFAAPMNNVDFGAGFRKSDGGGF
jgi:hypothetical protein